MEKVTSIQIDGKSIENIVFEATRQNLAQCCQINASCECIFFLQVISPSFHSYISIGLETI